MIQNRPEHSQFVHLLGLVDNVLKEHQGFDKSDLLKGSLVLKHGSALKFSKRPSVVGFHEPRTNQNSAMQRTKLSCLPTVSILCVCRDL